MNMKKYIKPQVRVAEVWGESLLTASPLSVRNAEGDADVEFVKREGMGNETGTGSGRSPWDSDW